MAGYCDVGMCGGLLAASLVATRGIGPGHLCGALLGALGAVDLAMAMCVAPLWCCAWSCGPLGFGLRVVRPSMVALLSPSTARHTRQTASAWLGPGVCLVQAAPQGAAHANHVVGVAGAPSQGGVCQVAPSSCRSFEGWLLLLDFAHVTCSP